MQKRSGKTRCYGVLLSGPSGVGKSAIGAEAALSCFARGLLCVYMPDASQWVRQAGRGHGDAFLLHQLLQQNVDLIARKPALRAALAPLLVIAPEEVLNLSSDASHAIMGAMTAALARVAGTDAIGLIVDEAQVVTAAVQRRRSRGCGPQALAAIDYFFLWHHWDHDDVFVRMDITGGRGNCLAKRLARKPQLPSRHDAHRLRFVRPLAADIAALAVASAGVPLASSSASPH